MKRISCAAILLAVAISVSFGEEEIDSATAQSPKYHARISQSTTNTGECVETIVVKGKGIDDKLEGLCAENDLGVIATEDRLVVGDPEKDSFVLFSDLPSNLMIIKKDKCERIQYTLTEKTKTDLSDSDCNRIKKKVTKELKSNKNVKRIVVKRPKKESSEKPKEFGKNSEKVEQSNANPWISDVEGLSNDGVSKNSYSTSTSTSEDDGKCTLSITIKGSGVVDRFKGPCLAENEPKVYIAAKTLIIGDINHDQLTLFSNERSTLYVISDGKTCTKKVYVTIMQRTASKPLPLTESSCKSIINKVKEAVQKAKSNPEQWTSNDPEILKQKSAAQKDSGASDVAPRSSADLPGSFTPPPGVTLGSRAYWREYAKWQRKQAQLSLQQFSPFQ